MLSNKESNGGRPLVLTWYGVTEVMTQALGAKKLQVNSVIGPSLVEQLTLSSSDQLTIGPVPPRVCLVQARSGQAEGVDERHGCGSPCPNTPQPAHCLLIKALMASASRLQSQMVALSPFYYFYLCFQFLLHCYFSPVPFFLRRRLNLKTISQ